MKSVVNRYLKTKIVISIILAFLMTAGHYIAFTENWNALFQIALLFPVRLLVSFGVLTMLYECFDRITPDNATLGARKIYFISFAVLMVIYFIEFCGLYPGIFAYDAPYQLYMYLSDTISEWHPVLHTYMIGKIIEIAFSLGFDVIAGIAFYTVLQIIIISLCFSYLAKFVYERSGKLLFWGVSVLFLGCFPTISLEVLTVTKDALFMCFFVLAMTLTVELISDENSFSKSRSKKILWALSVFFIIVFRNNCIYAIPFLIVPIFAVCKNRKLVLKLIIGAFVLFFAYKFLFVRAVVTCDVNGVETLSLPSQQLAKIFRDEDSVISPDQRAMIENLISQTGLDNFIPSSADAVKGAIDVTYYNENKTQIRKLWFDVVTHNQGKALRAFADLTCGYWYPIYDLTFLSNGEKAYWCVYSLSPYYLEPKILGIYKFYSFFNNTDFSDLKMVPTYLLFAPALYFYVFIMMIGYAVANKNKAFIVMGLFTFAYWGTFLFGPVALVRYTTYLFAILPIYFVTALSHAPQTEHEPMVIPVKKFTDNKLFAGITVFVLAFIFSLQSNSNIFVYKEQGVDSAVFQYVAKMMLNGYMPYRDTFDHKGPLLYVINLLGLIINEKWGVWLVELVFLTVAFAFMYKCFRLWSGRAVSLLVLALSFAPLGKYFYGGNYSEEYSITFTAISLFIFLDYFKNYRITNLRLFTCGLTFCAVLLLRPNNAALWPFMCLCVAALLIRNKDFKSFIRYIAWFLLGVMALLLPFIIWMLYKGILGDFVFCYIDFNFMYTETDMLSRIHAFKAFLMQYPVFVACIICAVYGIKNKSIKAFGYLGLIIFNLIFTALPGDTYVHYGLMLIPIIICPYAVLLSDLNTADILLIKYLKYVLAVACCVIIFSPSSLSVYIDGFYDITHVGEEYYPEEYAYIVGYTDYFTSEEDRVLYFGNCNRYYLLTDRLCVSKYSYQSPIFDVAEELGFSDEFFSELDRDPPKLIGVLTPAAYICDRERMENFLSDHEYNLVLITDDISLYVRS